MSSLSVGRAVWNQPILHCVSPPTHLLWPTVAFQANKLLPGEDRKSSPLAGLAHSTTIWCFPFPELGESGVVTSGCCGV